MTSDTKAPSLLASRDVPSIIDNAPWSGLQNSYDLKDPHTSELLWKVASVNASDAVQAVESAAKAFKTWKDTSAIERRRIFNKALSLLDERREEFVKISTTETTANTFWANTDIYLASNTIAETAACVTSLKGEIVPVEHGRAYVERIPYGVVFGISPWNAPLILGIRAFANAIMAGNTCVWKTSEYSPKIHTFAAQLFIDAGLPAGVLNVIHVAPADSPAVCEAVIAHPAVRKVNFTGSTTVGRKIGEMCGRHIKPVCLELGGKAPVVILKDANLKAAANAVMFGGLSHAGQVCMSSDRLIVHESVAKEFSQILSDLISKRPAAAELKEPMGNRGLFSQNSADRVVSMVKDALDKGAQVLAGKQANDKNVIQPIIVGNTTKHMRIFSEEIFGPAMSLNTFKTAQEAIDMANDTEFGLAASVYGSTESECWHVAQEIESGQVHINGATIHDVQTVPHGGLKNSGFGRFNGIEGLREFTTTKTITINPIPEDPNVAAALYPM